MGCQACSGVEKNEEVIVREILKCIQSENTSGLTFYLKNFLRNVCKNSPGAINRPMINVNNFKISFLAYALIAGSVKSFRLIHEKFSASISSLLENFSTYGMQALNIICEKHHFDLLKYFLPLFIQHRPATLNPLNDTLDFHSPDLKDFNDSFTPIQVACLHGSIPIVDYLHNFNKTSPSPLFNIEELNEEFGESCTLLAIRSGNLGMVKMLHRKYSQNFSSLNKFGENALQICAVSSVKKPDLNFLEIFVYLIEEAEVDPVINYEEVLIVLRDLQIVEYYEKVLLTRGIKTSKKEVDVNNEVKTKVRTQQAQYEKKMVNDSLGKCSLGSTIIVNSATASFLGGSIIGSKGWLNN